MRREFTVISGLSMAISFAAAVVLSLHISQLPDQTNWGLPPFTLWALEAAIFGTAVYIWRPTASLGGWTFGILALVTLRLVLTTSVALVLTAMQGSSYFAPALAKATLLAPRLCAAAFSLMVFYPLRVLLPTRVVGVVSDTSRFASSEAVEAAEARDGKETPSVVVLSDGEKVPFWQGDDSPAASARRRSDPVLGEAMDGYVNLPLPLLLSLLPDELAGNKQVRNQESVEVAVPLASIVPQLKEARILVSFADLHEWLPAGTMKKPPGSDSEAADEFNMVILPLAWVVPRLPSEVLELPPPSPPAWAEVKEEEPVVFATT